MNGLMIGVHNDLTKFSHVFFPMITLKIVSFSWVWVNYNDLTATSLEIIVSKGK